MGAVLNVSKPGLMAALLLLAGVLLVWCLPAVSDGDAYDPTGVHQDAGTVGQLKRVLPKIRMRLNGELFTLEVAITQRDILQGLMYRTSLPDKHGMLFPMTPPRAVNFWMKNTLVPLDMVFIRHRQVVHLVENARPCPKSLGNLCPVYPSVMPVDMVVELPAGSARRYQIQPGDPIQLESLAGGSQPADAGGAASPSAPAAVDDAPVTIQIPPKNPPSLDSPPAPKP